MRDETIDFWFPDGQTQKAAEHADRLTASIIAALGQSRQEVQRIVDHFLSMGEAFKAARCLEIYAQRQLGLQDFGEQLLRYDSCSFGTFHQTIHDLLWSASLYVEAQRARTAKATGTRALLFVEESIRNVKRINPNDNGEMACLAVAFELAGHCCVAVDAHEGLDYYRAAERYWGQTARMRPEAMLQWAHHPVTQTVIACLKPATALSPHQIPRVEMLYAPDYQTRLETAKQWLS